MEAWALALVGSPWVFVVLYLLATIDGFFPPIPSESIVIALAALAMSSGEPNLLLVVLVAAAGAFTGDQIAYQIGTKVKVREVRFLRSARAQAAIDWAERALEHRGASFIIAARYIPVGRVAVNMTAGALHYSRRRFSGLAALAAITWGIYSTAIGVGAAAWLGHNPILAVCVGVVGGVLLGVAIDWVLRRYHAIVDRRRGGRAGVATPVPLRGVGATAASSRAVAEDDAVA
ncbi:DedA family protein [Cellulomonas biazotea]|uniref:Membrane protein n=1 Tax=Cellulomonas biazotea TaxID=1709 RepID=A0A402DV61_9CELL|nr:VTT domain-containing protein [Cellulomonas biazotea]GCE77985.1 membrane protein [Cellulomonas biazotea]